MAASVRNEILRTVHSLCVTEFALLQIDGGEPIETISLRHVPGITEFPMSLYNVRFSVGRTIVRAISEFVDPTHLNQFQVAVADIKIADLGMHADRRIPHCNYVGYPFDAIADKLTAALGHSHEICLSTVGRFRDWEL